MTLRARLALVLVGVVAAGLLISDVVVYTQLRSFLVSRLDPELASAAYPVSRALVCNGDLARPPGAPACSVRSGPNRAFPPVGGAAGPGATRDSAFPTGTVGELVTPGGQVEGRPLPFLYGGPAPAPPVLPRPLPATSEHSPAYFDATSAGGGVAYRVLVRPLGAGGLYLVVAIPLTDANQTLGRLALVMVLVSLAVLIGLSGLAWWIVRRGLEPLEDMAATAGAIAGGDLGRRVAPADDRTEVGRLGLALNSMLGEIEAAFAARTASEGRLRRFLADASHELRTPLTSIRGYAEIFDLGASERPEDLATSMHHIREEADRMSVLVDDLLVLARLDRERPLDLGRMDLMAVAQRAVAAAGASAPDNPVSLTAPAALERVGDAARLRQVVDNLLVNAVRHSPEGGEVAVRVEAVRSEVLVEVADHGPGVPPAEAARIFEPFFRADSSRARTTGGAGLGLAIVAAIARAHGGTVGVRPNDGGGACFWVRLPVHPAAAGVPTGPPAATLGYPAAAEPGRAPALGARPGGGVGGR
ncbi:MAG: sensor histidine kinase [Acidimicrobiales bacterium]